MPKRVIKRGDEEFVVALADDGKSATVTDEKDFTVRISYTRGENPFQVRTPGGWGGWKRTMDDALRTRRSYAFRRGHFWSLMSLQSSCPSTWKRERQRHNVGPPPPGTRGG